jgi:hypothetical protein
MIARIHFCRGRYAHIPSTGTVPEVRRAPHGTSPGSPSGPSHLLTADSMVAPAPGRPESTRLADRRLRPATAPSPPSRPGDRFSRPRPPGRRGSGHHHARPRRRRTRVVPQRARRRFSTASAQQRQPGAVGCHRELDRIDPVRGPIRLVLSLSNLSGYLGTAGDLIPALLTARAAADTYAQVNEPPARRPWRAPRRSGRRVPYACVVSPPRTPLTPAASVAWPPHWPRRPGRRRRAPPRPDAGHGTQTGKVNA